MFIRQIKGTPGGRTPNRGGARHAFRLRRGGAVHSWALRQGAAGHFGNPASASAGTLDSPPGKRVKPTDMSSSRAGPICCIQPSDNGPLLVRGPLTLMDQEGNLIALKGRNVALCRCGNSANKPFCDGSHTRVGFRSAVRGLEQGRELAQHGKS